MMAWINRVMRINKMKQVCSDKSEKIGQWVRSTLGAIKLAHSQKPTGDKVKLQSPEKLNPATARLSSRKKDYFVEARSWADDMYTTAIISRNRYKLAFLASMLLSVILAIAIDGLIPLQHIEPLLINHYQDGRVLVQPIKQHFSPSNPAQVESEIVHYTMNRESYDPSSYHTQYSLINLMSESTVAKEYSKAQSTGNKHSPINLLGNHGVRRVHIDSVIFLDSTLKNKGKPVSQQTHYNLAQVNFMTIDHVKNSSVEKKKAYTALISWTYKGTPSDPNDIWRDWDGFTVTRYTVTSRNL